MTLQIPKTAADPADWIRKAADAVNAVITGLAALVKRTTDLETFQGSTTSALTALDGRIDDLETFTATPFTVASITLTPAALPGSPVEGQTVYDSADKKVKTWDGALWQAHY